MLEALYDCKTAVINSDLFVFSEYLQNDEYRYCVTKFWNKAKTWTCISQTGKDYKYCSICIFKQNFYVIEGECRLDYNF